MCNLFFVVGGGGGVAFYRHLAKFLTTCSFLLYWLLKYWYPWLCVCWSRGSPGKMLKRLMCVPDSPLTTFPLTVCSGMSVSHVSHLWLFLMISHVQHCVSLFHTHSHTPQGGVRRKTKSPLCVSVILNSRWTCYLMERSSSCTSSATPPDRKDSALGLLIGSENHRWKI